VILIVKSSLAFYIGISVVGALLAGCGQTGPLFMPKVPGKPVPNAGRPGASAPAAPEIVPVDPPAITPVSTTPSSSPSSSR
jgi:predicted small lipoprotein YifL